MISRALLFRVLSAEVSLFCNNLKQFKLEILIVGMRLQVDKGH